MEGAQREDIVAEIVLARPEGEHQSGAMASHNAIVSRVKGS